MIIHKPDRKALAERLIALRRARTTPLDRAQSRLSWRDWAVLAAGVLALLLLLSLVVAIVAWPPF